MRCSAVILAGGRSTRMGSDKSFLSFGGRTFVEAVLRNARSFCSEAVIVCGKHNEAAMRKTGAKVFVDTFPDEGPLMGIITGMRVVEGEWIFVLSVDAPLFDRQAANRLLDAAAGHDGAMYESAGRQYPLVAVYHRKTLPVWEHVFAAGERRIAAVTHQLDINYIAIDENQSDFLRNINTREELEELNNGAD